MARDALWMNGVRGSGGGDSAEKPKAGIPARVFNHTPKLLWFFHASGPCHIKTVTHNSASVF